MIPRPASPEEDKMKRLLNRKVSLATSLLVILLTFVGIGAIVTVRQGGIILYQDKGAEPGCRLSAASVCTGP